MARTVFPICCMLQRGDVMITLVSAPLSLSLMPSYTAYILLHTNDDGVQIFLTFSFLWLYLFLFSVRITAKEIPVSSDFCLLALFSHSGGTKRHSYPAGYMIVSIIRPGKEETMKQKNNERRNNKKRRWAVCAISFGPERTSGSVLKSPCVS